MSVVDDQIDTIILSGINRLYEKESKSTGGLDIDDLSKLEILLNLKNQIQARTIKPLGTAVGGVAITPQNLIDMIRIARGPADGKSE